MNTCKRCGTSYKENQGLCPECIEKDKNKEKYFSTEDTRAKAEEFRNKAERNIFYLKDFINDMPNKVKYFEKLAECAKNLVEMYSINLFEDKVFNEIVDQILADTRTLMSCSDFD